MRRLVAAAVAAGFCGLCGWVFLIASRPDPMPVGSPLPALAVRDVGSEVSELLAADGPTATVVMVYHTTCPACSETLRMLNDDSARLEALGLLLVTISSEPDSVLSEFRASWSALASAATVRWRRASGEELRRAFPLPGTPGFYVFAPDGRLLRKALGQRTLDALLAGLDESGVPDSLVREASADHRASHPRKGIPSPKEILR